MQGAFVTRDPAQGGLQTWPHRAAFPLRSTGWECQRATFRQDPERGSLRLWITSPAAFRLWTSRSGDAARGTRGTAFPAVATSRSRPTGGTTAWRRSPRAVHTVRITPRRSYRSCRADRAVPFAPRGSPYVAHPAWIGPCRSPRVDRAAVPAVSHRAPAASRGIPPSRAGPYRVVSRSAAPGPRSRETLARRDITAVDDIPQGAALWRERRIPAIRQLPRQRISGSIP